jgi:type I restriction enzyme R subunit
MDPFDLICHIAFDQPPLTRRERADGVKKRNVFSMYEEKAREVLGILLDKYADQGLQTISTIEVLRLDPFTKIGTPIELVKCFGGRDQYLKALDQLESALYATTA